MKVKKYNKKWKIRNEGGFFCFFLAQIMNDENLVDEERKLEKLITIDKIISQSAKEKNLSFLIFPENSIPHNCLKATLKKIEESLPIGSVTILGIEHISVSNYKQLRDEYLFKDDKSESMRIDETEEKHKLMNVALIIYKRKESLEIHTQMKIQNSISESNIDFRRSLFLGDTLKVFCCNNVVFTTLICSDFITVASGENLRTVDKLYCEILEEKVPPIDFLFNIQHNQFPDDEKFTNSLSRIYDDGHVNVRSMCTVFLNSIMDCNNKVSGVEGGLSKIMFSEKIMFFEKIKSSAKEDYPIKLVSAPVGGIEIPKKELLVELQFAKLPKLWDQGRNPSPFKYELHQLNEGDTIADVEKPKLITQFRRGKPLNYKNYEDLAKKSSSSGLYDEAIKWEREVISFYTQRRDYKRLAYAYKFIATQYRNMGMYKSSLESYTQAKRFLEKIAQSGSKEFEIYDIAMRIEAGIIMTRDYLINCDCEVAIKSFDSLLNRLRQYELEKYSTLSNEQKDNILNSVNNIYRQLAEMNRIIGDYKRAVKYFKRSFKKHKYYEYEEKANCTLGIANTLRMLYRFGEALGKYEEVRRIAIHHNLDGLYIRMLRNKCELLRCMEKEVEKDLDDLRRRSEESNSRTGKIYYLLIKGCTDILDSAEESLNSFRESEKLCSEQSNEHPMILELAHTYFGMGESCRIMNDFDESKKYYLKAQKLYKNRCRWGIENVGLALDTKCETNKIFMWNIP